MPLLDKSVYPQRIRTKIEGFGKPYDLNLVGGGPLEWFEVAGLPLGEWNKPSRWGTSDEKPTCMAPNKQLWPRHHAAAGNLD